MDCSTFFFEKFEGSASVGYNSEICCVALSSSNKIRIVCQGHNDYLKGQSLSKSRRITVLTNGAIHCFVAKPIETLRKDDLVRITNSVLDSSKFKVGNRVDRVDGWHAHKIVYRNHLWSHDNCKTLCIARLLIGRVVLQFGQKYGWSFLVNGDVKGTAGHESTSPPSLPSDYSFKYTVW